LKLNLKSELAAARAEVEELRQWAPSFESELNGLREQVAKQQKIISRLRAEHSVLDYQQKQLDLF
jgi:peptidoglycan hydrolase CwlO-like protein